MEGDATQVNLQRLTSVATQVVMLLQFMHEVGKFHGDISPSNIGCLERASTASPDCTELIVVPFDNDLSSSVPGRAVTATVGGEERAVVSVVGGGGTLHYAPAEQMSPPYLRGPPQYSHAICAILYEMVAGEGAPRKAGVGTPDLCAPLALVAWSFARRPATMSIRNVRLMIATHNTTSSDGGAAAVQELEQAAAGALAARRTRK